MMMYCEFDATFACGFCFFLCLYDPAFEIAVDVIVLVVPAAVFAKARSWKVTSFATTMARLSLKCCYLYHNCSDDTTACPTMFG